MSKKNWKIDDFFDTLLVWKKELLALRDIILQTELTEERKWGQPCYTYKEQNILILAHFKNYVAVSFIKGQLLNDPNHFLSSPGRNSNSVKLFKFETLTEIEKHRDDILDFVKQATQIEDLGLKVDKPKTPDKNDYPIELKEMFRDNPSFEEAFMNLTPGRKRSYLIFIDGAKQSQTKINRILKYMDKIYAGKGLNE